MFAIIFSSDHSHFQSRNILSPPTLHQYHIVLLECVALLWNEGRDLLPIA